MSRGPSGFFLLIYLFTLAASVGHPQIGHRPPIGRSPSARSEIKKITKERGALARVLLVAEAAVEPHLVLECLGPAAIDSVVMALDSSGLCSYGLYSSFLYSYGLYRYGLHGYGLYRYGLHSHRL